MPVWQHQQGASDGQWNNAKDYEEERGEPFWRKARGWTDPVPSMNRLTLSNQPHGQGTWIQKAHTHTIMFESLLFIIHVVCNFLWLLIHLLETLLYIIHRLHLCMWVFLFHFFPIYSTAPVVWLTRLKHTGEQHCLINPLYRAKWMDYARHHMADV